ncbi:MAG: discoidin domain-containing protein [Dysgonomonas sp.]
MKKIFTLLSLVLATAVCAQQPIKVGAGSYAEYTPLYKSKTNEHAGDQSRVMETRTLYITDQNKGKPIPSNDWWTDLLVSQYSGNLWAYPQVVNAEEYGFFVAYPRSRTADGNEMTWKTQIEVSGKQFNPPSALANNWHDWGLDFLMKDGNKEMQVTLAHGIPFTWVESKNLVLQLKCQNAELYDTDGQVIQLPFTGSRFVVEMNGDAYGIYAPEGTVFSQKNDVLEVTFSGFAQYLSIGVLPAKTDLDSYAEYAYTIPRKTEVQWNYDETSGKMATTWNLQTENLNGGTQKNVLQGFIPHHYKNSEYNFSFTPYEYTTPRGKMKMAVGNSFSIAYKFNGILPYFAAPLQNDTLKNPYQKARMIQMISDYANKGSFGSDTYWGGKGLTQMAMYMTFAYDMGEMELFEKCKSRLKDVLVNWLTFTPGEEDFFFARYPRWGALVGYNTSYDSDTFNDHHFHYGYFTLASGILALFDDDFKNKYGEMATQLAKDYANWDRNDEQYPFFRTLDPWAGHSYAGGLAGWGGNGQESSSEAMQGWGGVYMLGVATGNKAMRDAGIFGWTLEARGTAEYWFDRDRENIDYTLYKNPYNSNLTSQGVGWWTWFSGDPVWMHSIQWMPISPALKYLYEDIDFARWDYAQMWSKKEIGGWETQLGLPSALSYESGLGNVVLSYLQISDPDSAAVVFDNMWNADMPVVKNTDTGGISYYVLQSHRSYGDICWDIHADVPTATTYKHPLTGRYTYMVYNTEATEKNIKFYQNGIVIKEIKAPARKLTVYSDAPVLSSIQIEMPESKVVEPNANLQLKAVLLDQYGASVQGNVVWSVSGNGTITSDGLFSASASKGGATVTITNGALTDKLNLIINDKPVLATVDLLPQGLDYLEVGKTAAFSLDMKDQYGETYRGKVNWSIWKDNQLIKNDSILDLETVGVYTIKATVGDTVISHKVYLSPQFSNIALNKGVTVSSVENVGTIAVNATDGDISSRWGSEHSDPQWIYVDLGSPSYIGSVSIVWEASYASLYDIQVSDDATHWQTVKTINGLGKTETTEVNKTARYVRMYGNERSSIYGYSMYEFEVYGVPPTGSQPELFGIDISPKQSQIKEGDSVKVEVHGYDQFGNAMNISPTFSVLEGLGEVTSEGIFIPSTYGKAVVQAKVGNRTAKAEFIIEESIKLTTVGITPKNTSLIKGQSVTFSCEAKDQFGANYPDESLVYTVIGSGGILDGSTFTANTVGQYKIVLGDGKTISDTATVVVDELTNVNLALHKPVSASSYENAGTLPEYVNDGDMVTRWGSTFNDSEYIQVDLQDNFVIHHVNLFWDAAYANSYRIDVSLNDDDWTTVYSKTSASGGNESLEFSPAAARYVRIFCLTRNTNYGSSIKELEVYGSAFWSNPQPDSIAVSPSPLVAYIGEDLQVSAIVYDQYGLPFGGKSNLTWSVSGGGTIDNTGKFVPTGTGRYALTVKYGNLTENYVLEVLPRKVLTRLSVSPNFFLAKVAEDVQLSAEGYDQYGNRFEVAPVWSAAGAIVSQTGLFKASQAGLYTVVIETDTLKAKASVEVFEPDNRNLALNKPATSSSGIASAAVDGNDNTRWESLFQDGPEWLTVDLQDAYSITDVEILWEAASAKNYEVQVSKDGENWTSIHQANDLSGARTDIWRVSGIGRYIRLWCTKRATDYGYSVWELKVYGLLLGEADPYNIEIVSPETVVTVGDPVQFSAKVYNKRGAEISDPLVFWSSGTFGTIDSNGLVTPRQDGVTEVTAWANQVKAGTPVTILSTSGIVSENGYSKQAIYPNPANTVVNIAGEKADRVQIYSMTGKLMIEVFGTNQVDVSHLPENIYVIRVEKGNKNPYIGKLIIK